MGKESTKVIGKTTSDMVRVSLLTQVGIFILDGGALARKRALALTLQPRQI